ncbi:MAG: GyrI-like domain-containing protein [Cryobacterium sp.]|nr:GyrI-like domain-containing protein [Cryobacterium sp.]
MQTYDVKKEHRALYAPKPGEFAIVDVPEFAYLCVDGRGNPNTADAYRDAVEALYSVSYAVRFAAKKQLDRVHIVAPLEGLWWADDLSVFSARAKDAWSWTMMIHQPDWITADLVDAAIAGVRRKKQLPALGLVRFERFAEGLSVQTMHIGSYDEEAPVIERMHEFAASQGLALRGKHHEIYLSDPRKVEAAKLKTVLRQPVREN